MSLLPILCRCGHAHETHRGDSSVTETCVENCGCKHWMPMPVSGAKATDGTDLAVFLCVDGTSRIGFGPDGEGPYHEVAGCPNCGKGAGEWRSDLVLAAYSNSGIDPNETCSRACRYQLEWQAEIAARRLTEAPTDA